MLSTHEERYMGNSLWASSRGIAVADPNEGEEPDFSDPATIGCLLATAREAWQDAGLCTYVEKDWWGTNGEIGWLPSYGPPERDPILTEQTEGAAIVTVLESAVVNLDRLRFHAEQGGGR
jgi:hypothetical protein